MDDARVAAPPLTVRLTTHSLRNDMHALFSYLAAMIACTLCAMVATTVRVVPVFGKGALTVSPRIGHVHITVDDNSWHCVVASGETVILVGALAVGLEEACPLARDGCAPHAAADLRAPLHLDEVRLQDPPRIRRIAPLDERGARVAPDRVVNA